jgi:hypothetical protein
MDAVETWAVPKSGYSQSTFSWKPARLLAGRQGIITTRSIRGANR